MLLRPIRIEGEIAYIPLTKGYETVIDLADLPLVEGFNWTAQLAPRTVYAGRSFREAPGANSRTLLLHRAILDAPFGIGVDHFDGDGLNNRRINLRLATQLENSRNRKINLNNTSGFRGVSWHKRSKKWAARITLKGVQYQLGYFTTEEAAHEAYSNASVSLHGEFGKTILKD